MKDLTAPQPGDSITVTGVVLTSRTHADNKFYGTGFAQLRVKIDNGPDGYTYADLRLVVDDTGKWLGRKARVAATDVAPEPTPDMSKAQLLALADARGLDVPSKATKGALLGLLSA